MPEVKRILTLSQYEQADRMLDAAGPFSTQINRDLEQATYEEQRSNDVFIGRCVLFISCLIVVILAYAAYTCLQGVGWPFYPIGGTK